jgi:putative membrane protein
MWHPDSLVMAVTSTLIFGLIGILLTVLGFKVFDWITPKIDVEKELAEKHNIAVAIVVGAIILGISIVMASIVSA